MATTPVKKAGTSIIQVDSQALIKSYNRNIRVVLVIVGAFLGCILYGFVQGVVSLLWVGLTFVFSLGLLAWASSFLLKSVFVDKSMETLLRNKAVSNA